MSQDAFAGDVFALGHLAVYAATGHSVFGDGHQSAIVYRIANEPPDLGGCPDTLRELVARCLAKEPADRPDLAEIIEFARAGLAGQTMQVARGSWLPDPVAGALAAYGTSMAPAPAPQTYSPTSAVTPATAAPSGAPGPVAVAAMPPVTRLDPTRPDAPGGSGYPPTGPTDPRPRRRGRVRPAIVVPVVLVLLAAVGIGAYLAGRSNGATPPPKTDAAGNTPAARTHASTAAKTSPSAGATASSSTSPSAPNSPSATATASAATSGAAANAGEYSTPEPFPLCDPNDAQWNLVNLTPQSSGGCAPGMTVAVTNADGFGYGTTSKFPNGTPITSSNTVTLSSNLPGNGGYQNWCMGVTEGSAATGYFAYLCNTGTWTIKSVIGLGTNGVILGSELASGTELPRGKRLRLRGRLTAMAPGDAGNERRESIGFT